MNGFVRSTIFLVLAVPALVVIASEEAAATASDWVAVSDTHTRVLLEVMARFNPEAAAALGIDGLDERITQLPPNRSRQRVLALTGAIETLEAGLAEEADPRVRQDLEILIESARRNIEAIELNDALMLPSVSVAQMIHEGVRSLLNEQVDARRHPAALVRLRRYAGIEDGYTPLTSQAEALIRSRLASSHLIGPFEGELERDLATSQRYFEDVVELLSSHDLGGHEEVLEVLERQLNAYRDFLAAELLPRARTDFRLPQELYELRLRDLGVDMTVAELSSRALVAFREIQNELRALAPLVAARLGLETHDYADVICHLRQEQLEGEEILTHYTSRIAELEKIIAREGIVTLPRRGLKIRLASRAESAAIPSPFVRPPQLIGNTGEMAELVLPDRIPAAGSDNERLGDFTFAAASWTLAVHEGRPGHELQYSSMLENGVSRCRLLFAFNSVNVEGWALYSEAEMRPFFPLEGQLVSLQHRLLRAARAFLDPGLQSGRISHEEALRVLQDEVAVTAAMAHQEIERYTFLDPGQATSYFCGYLRLMELRAEAQRLLGDRFDPRTFHDLVLAQGLLPPRLLREAVLAELTTSP